MSDESIFKAKIVYMILSKGSEEALESLGEYYRVETPMLRVGMPKAHGNASGCYVSSKKTIFLASSENLYNPYIILHEFYHHLRMDNGKHKGTEKLANKFAQDYFQAYRTVTSPH